MAYDNDDIKRDIRKQRVRKDGAPPREISEAKRLKQLETDLYRLLLETDDRDFFAEEVERLTARCGLRTEREQKQNALRLFDQIQKKKNSLR